MKGIFQCTTAASVLFAAALSICHAGVRHDEPECSRCGDVRLVGIKPYRSEVICAVARLGCVNWSDAAEVDLAYGRIQAFFRDRGFFEATVSPSEAPGQVSVKAGPAYRVSGFRHAGNQTIPDGVVQSVVFDNAGMQYDRAILEASIRNINELGFFEPITIDDVRVIPDAQRRIVDIVFNLTERPLRNGPSNERIQRSARDGAMSVNP